MDGGGILPIYSCGILIALYYNIDPSFESFLLRPSVLLAPVGTDAMGMDSNLHSAETFREIINASEIRLARYYDGGKLEVRCVAEIKVTTRKHFSVGTGFGTHITLYRKKDTKSRVLFING